MEIDRDKAIKLVIIVIATLAALAVMSTIIQLIQTILPFLIVAAGVYVGYRWVLSDTAAPTTGEVEEQARGLFSRFRKTKDAVEATMKVGSVLSDLGINSDKKEKKEKSDNVVQGEAVVVEKKESKAKPVVEAEPEAVEEEDDKTEEAIEAIKKSVASNPDGKVEFKDRDVVISKDDVLIPDTSRLEEKEKEVPKVTDNVLSQIEERRRRLQGGE